MRGGCREIWICVFEVVWRRILDGNSVYQDSKELFDDLWQMWLDYKILDSVAGTEREDIDYKKLYEELSAETRKEYDEKRQQFLRLSGLCD